MVWQDGGPSLICLRPFKSFLVNLTMVLVVVIIVLYSLSSPSVVTLFNCRKRRGNSEIPTLALFLRTPKLQFGVATVDHPCREALPQGLYHCNGAQCPLDNPKALIDMLCLAPWPALPLLFARKCYTIGYTRYHSFRAISPSNYLFLPIYLRTN